MDIVKELSEQFALKSRQVENIISLIDEGNTIPFIARYRKEAHGSLDDQTLREVNDRLEYLRNLIKRREEITDLIEAQEKMTPEIKKSLDEAKTLTELEDIYRPFKPKRKTRASVAIEKGLELLAQQIFEQDPKGQDPLTLAEAFVNEEKGVASVEEAVDGAKDIIAEMLSDDASLRKRLRVVAMAQSIIESVATDPEADSVYRQYYDFREPVNKILSHRVLALNRGEKEKFLKVSIDFDKEKALNIVYSVALKEMSPCYETVRSAAEDA